MSYCIDTSALIDAWVRWYPRDVFPSLWDRIEALVGEGEIVTPDEVLHELERKEDSLLVWAKERKDMFRVLDEDLQRGGAEILGGFPNLVDSSSSITEADPWVIALAREMKASVVTGEKPTGQLESKPHIPDVCKHYGIKCIGMLELIREQGWIFR